MTENEKGALRSLSLDIAISKNLETGNAMDDSISRDATGAEDVNDLTSPDNLALLRDSLGKSGRDSLRERQLHHMLHGQERIRAMQQEFARQPAPVENNGTQGQGSQYPKSGVVADGPERGDAHAHS